MSLLEVRGAQKRYGKLRALDDVDLRVEPGEFHGLIGPNGSGKSTLLQCIAGGTLPDEGSVSLLGRDVTSATAAKRARLGLSVKFQITSVFPLLTVYDNVLLAMQARESVLGLALSRTRRALDNRVIGLVEKFRLGQRAGDPAGELSHGEQQWLEIAMALASEPKLLLLDEPTGGMSLEERRATGRLLESVKGDCSLLIVEHDIEFIKGLCDVLTVLDQGRVLDHGTVEHIESSERVKKAYVKHA